MLAVTPSRREGLAAMILELQMNRAVLYGLANWFSVFVFTGGGASEEWNLVATTAYLKHPAAADSLSTSELECYRRLVQTIGDLGQQQRVPRTLKCRHSLGDRFSLAASELRLVTDATGVFNDQGYGTKASMECKDGDICSNHFCFNLPAGGMWLGDIHPRLGRRRGHGGE